MSDARAGWVDGKLGGMNLDQKVGQLMVFGFCGPVVTPDVLELIRDYHVGGLRISQKFRTLTITHDVKPGEEPDENVMRSFHPPRGLNRDCAFANPPVACTAEEYAESLNTLRMASLDRDLGIPIHFTIDQEGNASDDLLCGTKLFPAPMGYAAASRPDLAYKVAKAVGMQAGALGVNMIHSPVLDVNTNPDNPEIGPRAYSDKTGEVARYALQSLKGFQETGLIATGKHFPGRGESISDAHWCLPVVDLDRETLLRDHIAPYKALIEAGLPAVMVGHSRYPALGNPDIPSSVSSAVITDFLRGELGFKGVVTTDNMMMGGILQKYELSDAVVRAVQAGCDLVLVRDESPVRVKILEGVKAAVNDGRISEGRLDESVARILAMRYDMGLANGGLVDAARAAEPTRDRFVVETAREAAEETTLLIRDEQDMLPLDPGKNVLLVEQVFPTHQHANNMGSHPGMLWEMMCRYSGRVGCVEIPIIPSEADEARVMRRLDEADVLVITNYYYHKAARDMTGFVRRIIETAGKPTAVITNHPYPRMAPQDLETVLCVFTAGGKEALDAAARVLFGKLEPTAKLPYGE